MKIFATNYLEAMSEDVDGNDWSWKPASEYKNSRGRPTKTMMEGGCPGHPIPMQDEDQPQEGMASGMLIA